MTEGVAKGIDVAGAAAGPPPVPVHQDAALSPKWARLDREPADGWRMYRDRMIRTRRALVAGMKSDGLTHEAVHYVTRWTAMQPGGERSLAELIEHLAGYRPPWVGLAEAVGEVGRTWRPADFEEQESGKSRPVYVLPVWSAGETITAVDIVAWSPATAHKWGFRTSLTDMLGEDRVDEAALGGTDLRIYRTPADWIAGEETWPGVCVLHDERLPMRDPWRRFEGIPALVCDEDEAHAALVHKMTRRPLKRALPKILKLKSGECDGDG